MRRFYLLIIWCCWTNCVAAQNTYRYGSLPSFNFSKKLKKNWKLDGELESRQRFKSGTFGESSEQNFKHERVDISLVAAKKIGLNNKIAGGYLMRITKEKPQHRLMQQLTFVRDYNTFRLAHRIATDQTFGGEDPLEIRIRYRIGAEIPLNGLFVDPNEFYFKITHEYLNKFSEGDYDLEVRLVPTLGYLFTDTNKVEVAVDYRVDGFLDRGGAHDFWLGVGWFLKL